MSLSQKFPRPAGYCVTMWSPAVIAARRAAREQAKRRAAIEDAEPPLSLAERRERRQRIFKEASRATR